MAKKVYHIPLDESRRFIQEHKSDFHRLTGDRRFLEYAKRFGRARYDERIEAFLIFFKIDKELGYALKTLNHFSSDTFLHEVYALLNFAQFALKSKSEAREFFYGFCYLFHQKNETLFPEFNQ